jgi:hypothetical protein
MKTGDLIGLQRCADKVSEVAALLKKHGVRVYEITNLEVLERDFGTATLVIDLDFRKKTSGARP